MSATADPRTLRAEAHYIEATRLRAIEARAVEHETEAGILEDRVQELYALAEQVRDMADLPGRTAGDIAKRAANQDGEGRKLEAEVAIRRGVDEHDVRQLSRGLDAAKREGLNVDDILSPDEADEAFVECERRERLGRRVPFDGMHESGDLDPDDVQGSNGDPDEQAARERVESSPAAHRQRGD